MENATKGVQDSLIHFPTEEKNRPWCMQRTVAEVAKELLFLLMARFPRACGSIATALLSS